jgi:hypothetical protein
MEPEGSSPHSQEPATCPYPELIYSVIKYLLGKQQETSTLRFKSQIHADWIAY